jgi:hypothetical protein
MRILLALLALAPVQEPPALKLIDSGRGEKRTIRFKPVAGARRTQTLTLKSGLRGILDGKQDFQKTLANHAFRMDVSVAALQEPGEARYEFSYGKVEGDPALGDLRSLEGIRGRLTATDRGIVRDCRIEAPGRADEESARIAAVLERSRLDRTPCFPQEPVGVGASWEVRQTVVANGARLQETVTFRLVALTDRVATVWIDAVQTAGAQDLKMPGLPADLRLVSYDGRGGGEFQWDLAWGEGPSSASFSLRGELKAARTVGGATSIGSLVFDHALKLSSGGSLPTAATKAPRTEAASKATRTLDPWAGREAGTWYRFRTSGPDGDRFEDVGLRGRDGADALLSVQRFAEGKAGAEEPLRSAPATVAVLGDATVRVQDRDHACEIREDGAGGRLWAIKAGPHAGAVLRHESAKETFEADKVWEHTLKVKGREFACLVVEGNWRAGDRIEAAKTWHTAKVPPGAIRREREGVWTNLVDFGADWSGRPPFPGAAEPRR